MRTTKLAMAATAAILVLTTCLASARAQISLGVFTDICETDDEVAAGERDIYEKSAMNFVEALLSDHPERAYGQLTSELRTGMSADDFPKKVEGVLRYRPFAQLHIEHSYRDSQKSVGSARHSTLCTAVARGSSDKPEGRVTIALLPVPQQAHVIIGGKATNDHWAFTIWLVPDRSPQEPWQITGFDVRAVTILERTATDTWTLARRERDAGHALNAYLLFSAAKQLAYRGPNLQLGIYPEIEKELAALEVPSELKNQDWKLSDETYHVLFVGPVGIGKTIYLHIQFQAAQSDDNDALERRSRAFLAAFKETHPEYAEAFDALFIEAVRPDGSGFRSTDEQR